MATPGLFTITTVRTEGALLPTDLLLQLSESKPDIPGIGSDYYHLAGEKHNEAINRAWSYLVGVWRRFLAITEEQRNTTTMTRERWLLPLFESLGYGRLEKWTAQEIGGKSFAISHIWQQTPIHLLAWNIGLDEKTPKVAGASNASPHSMVQDFLNRSEPHLWAFLSNGRYLRLLRDNVSMSKQALVEFDLETIFNEERYSDFALLWMICHQSRFEPQEPHSWIEQWVHHAREQGSRALDSLRLGVKDAIEALGKGFLLAPGNRALVEKLEQGQLSPQDFYRQLLRLVYRLIFLCVAEDRQLLLKPDADSETRDRYRLYYSLQRIRQLAGSRRSSSYLDLWEGLLVVMNHLGQPDGCPALGLPALGSFLWSPEAIPDLQSARLRNRELLDAFRVLTWRYDEAHLRPVDFKNLGAEELGSVYEALLEMHPQLDPDTGHFALKTAPGNERKTTGSYYTPTSLIMCLLDSALNPVMQQAIQDKDADEAVEALLNLKICDPACGSGHFLIAAAHRLAKWVAQLRTGDEEPSPVETQKALRDVIGRCIYGVDINPMSVELCKVSLWMEALQPGKPLSFLDHHIQCGNSLLGATPELIEKGIPDEAFTAIEGDDKPTCATAKKANKAFRTSLGQLDWTSGPTEIWAQLGTLGVEMLKLGQVDDGSVQGIQQREALYRDFKQSDGYALAKTTADAWCAAFVWLKVPELQPITESVFWQIKRNPHTLNSEPWRKAEIGKLAEQYQFFHWHLAFPEVFSEQQGFDCVLGNPPWERVKLQEQEFFASKSPEIAQASNAAARKRLIASLPEIDPALHHAFTEAKRQAEGESHFIRQSEKYPLCGRGDVNTYTIFTELNRNVINGQGRVGCIVPSGIATDDTTKFFFQDLVEKASLVSLFDFENAKAIFQGVHRSYKFCLLTLTGLSRPAQTGAEFVFFAHQTEDLLDYNRRFVLSAQDIALINPNTKTCPIFRTQRDAEITKAVYRRVPVLIQEEPEQNPWGIRFNTMFHMSNDSGLFQTNSDLANQGLELRGNRWFQPGSHIPAYLPLYEAKMVHHYNHRFGDYTDLPEGSASTQLPDVPLEQLQDADFAVQPRYWVPTSEVKAKLEEKWKQEWFLGFRDICRSTDERTVIASLIPFVGVGNNCPIMILGEKNKYYGGFLLCNLTSFVLDFLSRFKVGGTHLNFFIANQLSILPPKTYARICSWSPSELVKWLLPRVLELTYTTWDLQPFAQDCGYDGPPFIWDDARRFLLRCELDAAYFHLYEINRDDVGYIMDTFPIVKRKDEAAHGEYRTKRVILEIYDAMQQAIQTGKPYQTLLDPPPADPRVAHNMVKQA